MDKTEWVLVPREPTPEMLDAVCTNVEPWTDTIMTDTYSAMLAAAPQPPAEAHCATCSCVPGMTPAVRFDTTPAERGGAVRDHLIRMGWTPPAEAQAQGGGEVICPYDGKSCLCRKPRGKCKACVAPPSAPVGVDRARRQAVLDLSEAARCLGVAQAKDDKGAMDYWGDKVAQCEAALAQQPAAARGDVRGLVGQLKHELAADKGWDYTEYEKGRIAEKERRTAPQQPAAEGVQAGEVEERAGTDEAMHWIDRYAAGIDSECQIDRVASALSQQPEARGVVDVHLRAEDVQWIVNDIAELGVRIGGQCFFLYKGGSLVYEDGKHDDGTQMHIRTVGKREFGECCHPINHSDYTKIGTVSLEDSDRWEPMPAALTGERNG